MKTTKKNCSLVSPPFGLISSSCNALHVQDRNSQLHFPIKEAERDEVVKYLIRPKY